MNLKFRKGMSMIEMIAVIIIMVILLAFIVSRLVNFNPFDKEGNIPTLLKDYVSAVKLAHTNDINTLKSISFKKLFVENPDASTKQGFVKVISNCHYEPSEFVTAQTTFTNKFKEASVWATQAPNFPIQPIDNIRSVLNKLWEWRMYFAAGKKSELINKDAKEYKSIGDYVYVVLIEHSKANRAEFKSDALKTINGNDGTDAINYYNAVVLDSTGMIYDGLNSQFMIRSLLGKTLASGETFDELVDFDQTVIGNIKTKATPVCLS